MLSAEIVERARKANLAEYLLSRNVPLTKSGQRYRHRDHDSLVFTANAYYWNSRQEYGNAVDYLTRHMGMTFNEAVESLTRGTYSPAETCRSDEISVDELTKSFTLDLEKDQRRVIAYLNKTRGIDYGIINKLLKNKHLFQERVTNNVLFPIYDELNVCVGAEVTGTLSERRFKGLKPNSKYGYGFNLRFPSFNNPNVFNYTLFFESAIDLLSFVDIKMRRESKRLDRCILTSMSGLKLNVIRILWRILLRPNSL